MNRHSLHRARTLLTALFAVAGAACTLLPIMVGPRPQLELHTRGRGEPVVLLQSGLGDGLTVWQALQTQLETSTTSVAYSRPGYGRSVAIDAERSACAVAHEAHSLLHAQGLRPPYLLVGHSLGGLYQYAYAKLYLAEVAGLVLLDPTHPNRLAALQRDAPAVVALIGAAKLAFTPTLRREFDDQAKCLDELRAAPMPAVPARMLGRGRFSGLEAGRFENVVRGREQDWVRLLGAASAERVDGADHYLQRDRPDVVADAVTALVAQSARR